MKITFNPSFRYNCSPSFQAAKPQIKEELFALPKKEIFQRIKTSLKHPENLLGTGGEAEVWKIENSDYCIRIPNHISGRITTSLNRKLTNDDIINHTVAKLGQGATIMPIIEGVTLGSDNIEEEKDVTYIIEKLPVSAYEDLIRQINYAENTSNMIFDIGMNNIIINPQTQRMTAIDFYKPKYNDENWNNQILSDIYFSLAKNPVSSKKQQKICACKILLAARNTLQNLNIGIKSLGIEQFLNELLQDEIIDKNSNVKSLLNDFKKNSNNIAMEVKNIFGITI